MERTDICVFLSLRSPWREPAFLSFCECICILFVFLNMIKSPPCKVVLTVLCGENLAGVVVFLPGSSAHLQHAFGKIFQDMVLVPSKIKRAGSFQNFDANGNTLKIALISSGSGSSPFQPRSSSWSRWGGLPSHAQAPVGEQSKIISQVLSG